MLSESSLLATFFPETPSLVVRYLVTFPSWNNEKWSVEKLSHPCANSTLFSRRRNVTGVIPKSRSPSTRKLRPKNVINPYRSERPMARVSVIQYASEERGSLKPIRRRRSAHSRTRRSQPCGGACAAKVVRPLHPPVIPT